MQNAATIEALEALAENIPARGKREDVMFLIFRARGSIEALRHLVAQRVAHDAGRAWLIANGLTL
jgi:hypothetical protein